VSITKKTKTTRKMITFPKYSPKWTSNTSHIERAFLIHEQLKTINDETYWACKNNHTATIALLASQKRICNESGILGACAGGHIHLIDIFMKKGVQNVKDALAIACLNQQLDAIKCLYKYKKQSDCWESLSALAYVIKSRSISWYLQDQGIDGRNLALYYACMHDRVDILTFVLLNASTNVDWMACMSVAFHYSNIRVACLLMTLFVDTINDYYYRTEYMEVICNMACKQGFRGVIFYFIKRYNYDWKWIFHLLSLYKHEEIMLELIQEYIREPKDCNFIYLNYPQHKDMLPDFI
jgi:hypothetical protein